MIFDQIFYVLCLKINLFENPITLKPENVDFSLDSRLTLFLLSQAHRALREAQKDIFSPDDCSGIKGIGPTISKFLAEQFRLGIQNGSIRAPPGYTQPASISPSTSPNVRAKSASALASRGDEDVVAAFLQPLGKAFSENYAWALRREVRPIFLFVSIRTFP